MSAFIEVLNLSYLGSIVILFVLAARLFLKKVPKKYSYILWLTVLLRLTVPYSFASVLSFLPSNSHPISTEIVGVNSSQSVTETIEVGSPVNTAPMTVGTENLTSPNFFEIALAIWLVAMLVLMVYGIVLMFRMKRLLKWSRRQEKNIFVSEQIEMPFVLGIIKPKIYLPENLNASEKQVIILHEQMHIQRFDPQIRFLSYAVLCLHWFNPLVWLAFYLSGKDMEMACDEAVVRRLGNEIKIDYSQSLLKLAAKKHNGRFLPLAFGEGDTKERIKNILRAKKPKRYVVVLILAFIALVSVGLLTNPFDGSVWLTEKEIVKTFKSDGLVLVKDQEKDPSDYLLGGIAPGIYKPVDYDAIMYIYIFENLNERKEITQSSPMYGFNNRLDDSITNSYFSKNALIVLEVPSEFLNSLEYSEFLEVASVYKEMNDIVSESVLLDLNEGEIAVYKGESQHWTGTYTYSYYNLPIEDEDGRLQMDAYFWDGGQLSYNGSNRESVGQISYESSWGSSGTCSTLDDGDLSLGGGGGSSAKSVLPSQVEVTVNWNNQSETLILKLETEN